MSQYGKHEAIEEFKHWSVGYDESIIQRLLFEPCHNAMLEKLTDAPPRRLLDIGAGTGIFALRAAMAFPELETWALDLSYDMLNQGAHRLTSCSARLRYVQGDSEHLPFDDGSFDAITCANSFHHYPNQERAVREMHRVLRPGGRLLIVDGYRDSWWGGFVYDVCVVAAEGKVNHLSAGQFELLYTECGFSPVKQHISGFRLAPFIVTEGYADKAAVGVPLLSRKALVA